MPKSISESNETKWWKGLWKINEQSDNIEITIFKACSNFITPLNYVCDENWDFSSKKLEIKKPNKINSIMTIKSN